MTFRRTKTGRRSLASAVTVVAALAALPAGAQAAQFGGGAIVGPPTAVNRGVFEQIWFESPAKLPGRMTVSMEVDNLRCRDAAFGAPANTPITTEINRFARVKVDREGRFSATYELDQTAPTGEKSKGRSTLKGRLRGRTATGTIKAFINVSDENGNPKTRCELVPTRWFASAGRVSGDRRSRPDGRRYFGVNDTRSVAKTRLNAVVNLNRRRTRGAIVVTFNARCEKETPPVFGSVDYSPIFEVKDGRFTMSETYDLGDPGGPGQAARITTRYAGAFVEGGVKGTLRIRATLFEDGREVNRCDTGRARWRAREIS